VGNVRNTGNRHGQRQAVGLLKTLSAKRSGELLKFEPETIKEY
jgi:hypothetical protein